jgi:hypothetical protein
MTNFKITKTSLLVLPILAVMAAFILNGCNSTTTTQTPSTRTYNQVDQVGRPAINTVFVGASDSTQKDLFNHTVPSQMQATFLATFTARLLQLYPGYTTNALGLNAAAFCGVLVNDVLTVSTVGSTHFGTLTGRTLDDNVIKTELTLIFGGPNGTQNPCLTDDHVDANDVPFLPTFPFMANPH